MRHAWVGAEFPEGRRLYRVTSGSVALPRWRAVRRWSMADGTALATLWSEL